MKECLGDDKKKMDRNELEKIFTDWNKTKPWSRQRALAEAQIEKTLAGIGDPKDGIYEPKTLISLWDLTSFGSGPRELLEERIIEVLSTVTCMHDLREYWGKASFTKIGRLIEARVTEIHPGTDFRLGSDWFERNV